jgi:hypothetical protein
MAQVQGELDVAVVGAGPDKRVAGSDRDQPVAGSLEQEFGVDADEVGFADGVVRVVDPDAGDQSGHGGTGSLDASVRVVARASR